MNDEIHQLKKSLRSQARKRRQEFVAALGAPHWRLPEQRHIESRAGENRIALDRGVPVGSYRPIGSEADPADAECRAVRAQACLGWPRIDTDGVMRFYNQGPSRAFTHTPTGHEVPPPDGWPLEPVIFFIPLLAFDRRGTRLGQGGGHYDRALARVDAALAPDGCRSLKIGIAWSVQEMADLPREPWDIPLDIVITEREWIVTS